jgi:hypothetical protein
MNIFAKKLGRFMANGLFSYVTKHSSLTARYIEYYW